MAIRIALKNGDWVDADSLAVSISDPAVTQAVTAVERMRTYQGRWFQIDRHLERWQRSTTALLIDGLPTPVELAEHLDELLQRNQAWIASRPVGATLIASPGIAGTPTWILDLNLIDQDRVRQQVDRGTALIVTDVQQPSPKCWPRDIKVRSRLHYYLADQMAKKIAPDALGLLVDQDGSITETSVANVLIVESGCLITPPTDQILCGVSLQVIRDLATLLGLNWSEQRLFPERLRGADEVLLTGTSCGIWFACSVDDQSQRAPGPVYRKLRRTFEALVG
ncbi:aminotransferase class IV [Stieleria sp. TO1_6]|uniref:aminotransferase class IV n=1 Tax=Stieleria tagensis TaxID=2956795 RepID=UPI00209AF518|nr:aminotransferase class IV [Stieleria tagensis]MCO8121492.1 aminotransferase class IV [Stieleria tagensis]